MEYRIEKIGFSYEVQRLSARNYDGYYCKDWHTVATFQSEKEAQRYIEETTEK